MRVMPVYSGITCASMCEIPSGKMATRPFCFNLAEIALNEFLFDSALELP
jgi:hypothetical protein